MSAKNPLDQIKYNPETGHFFKKGKRVGTVLKTGYRKLSVNSKQINEHRYAWFLMTGDYPADGLVIDHINGIRDDNRWCNLRLATRRQNSLNSKKPSSNTSGIKGVSWSKVMNKWDVYLRINGRKTTICYCEDLEFAELVISEARSKYHGEFSHV